MIAIPPTFESKLKQLDVTLTADQLQTMGRYLEVLLEANQRTNLTAIRDIDQAWDRHILDSLTLVAGLTPPLKLIDVGTGAGLPGIPLAIALPDLEVTLLETTGKKANFCKQCIQTLGLKNVYVIHDRAETLGQDSGHRENYDVAVSRAVGPMRILLEFMLPLVAVGGAIFAIKGPSVEQELQVVGDALSELGAGDLSAIDAYPPEFDNHSVIVIVQKDRSTPKMYPRLPGIPKQSPL